MFTNRLASLTITVLRQVRALAGTLVYALASLLSLLAALVTLVLAGCGGGGGWMDSPGPSAGTAVPLSASSGTITALGGLYVNGQNYGTSGAQVVDDDTGTTSTDLSILEVGMDVDVIPASGSYGAAPAAAAIHLHPLARGPVDAYSSRASTLSVMGQTVLLTASTLFRDHRACVRAATSPCTAISGPTGLATTSGSGSSAVAGSYVTVHGYLYAAGAASAAADIVATLVAVGDAPTATSGMNYKAEGVVTATGAGSLSLGGLSVTLGSATCYAGSGATPCASAFSVGQVVSAIAGTAPALPASSFAASTVALHPMLPVQTTGTVVQLQGKVSALSTSPAGFTLRGVAIDASLLPAASLPAAGDEVRVTGTVEAGGTAVSATAVKLLHAALSATYGFEGDVSGVAAGAASGTWTISVLSQTISVDGTARLLDASMRGGASSGNPFDITTFQTYLAASASQHLIVNAQANAAGSLSALTVTIVPASNVAGVAGVVDASPAPVNSSATGTPTTFSVHGVALSVDPAAFLRPRQGGTTTTVAAGDWVLALGTLGTGTLTVTAPSSGQPPAYTDYAVDLGPPGNNDRCGF